MIQHLQDFIFAEGAYHHLGLSDISHSLRRIGFDVSFLLHVVEKGLEYLEQIVDIPWLPPLVIHRHQKLLHVEAPHIFHLIDLEFCLQIPLKIPQLLLLIADRLIQKVSSPASQIHTPELRC